MWKGVLNWLISGLGVGLAVFIAEVTAGGIPTWDAVWGALAAAGAAMVQHLRAHPWDGKKDDA
jgi:hypothetical protein